MQVQINLIISSTMLMTFSRSFGKMAMSFLFILVTNSSVMVCKISGSIVSVRSELLGFWKAAKIAIKLLTSSLILVISTVEQFSTFGSSHIAGSPSHNLDASPKIIIELNLVRSDSLLLKHYFIVHYNSKAYLMIQHLLDIFA